MSVVVLPIGTSLHFLDGVVSDTIKSLLEAGEWFAHAAFDRDFMA